MRRFVRAIALTLASGLALVGCAQGTSSEESPSPTAVAPTASALASVEPSPSPEPQGPQLPAGTLNALVIGTDSRTNDWGGRPDMIMVVQLSADHKDLTIVSIARDTYVEIPGKGSNKINSSFSSGGTSLLKQTVSNLLGGLKIDYVVQTNFDGFIALTRGMEGFTVENKHANTRKVVSTGRVLNFPKGEIRLENTDGLAYVRERKQLPQGDLDRQERGRAALVGMMKRLVEITQNEPEKLPALLPLIYENINVTGDLQMEHIPVLIDLGRGILGSGEIRSLMVPISGFAMVKGQSVNMLDKKRTAELGEALRAGDVSPYIEKYGEKYSPTGNR